LTKIRLLSVLCYFGFAPQFRLLGINRERNDVLKHHINNGLILSTVLLSSIIFCIVILFSEYFIEYHVPLELIVVQLVFTISAIPTLFWGLLTIFGVSQAFRGSTMPIPIVSQLSRIRGIEILSIFCGLLLQLAIILPVRANYLVRSPSYPASVYILYETTDYFQLTHEKYWYYTVPRWLIAAEFYRISESAVNRWGAGSVAIEPLIEANLTKAFQEGRLVIVTAHGGYIPGTISYSQNPNEYYAPEDIEKNGGIGPNLQFVYITGCNVGNQEDVWKKSLEGVDLVVFDRISFEQEHFLWYIFNGPMVVSNLK